MSKINLLKGNIIQLIKAGEVIAGAFSVVKELVENSIDSKASKITVEIKKFGLEYIRVSDNGCGIEYDDLPNAFLEHGTSKLLNEEDLFNISTLGFRGEALPSIAKVSHTSLISKVSTSEIGGEIKVSDGKVVSIEKVGSIDGTIVTVNNLFYNLPARRKYISNPKIEENEITALMIKLVLSSPNIAFKYIIDGDIKFSTNGSGLKNAIYSIFGADIYENLYEVIGDDNNQIKLSGFIGAPNIYRSNKSHQFLFVNGRSVVNQNISIAVHNTYGEFLMKGNYPFFCLNLTVPFEEVDVNVHPNKTEVRFKNNAAIISVVYKYILKTLDKFKNIANVSLKSDNISNVNEIFTPIPLSKPDFIGSSYKNKVDVNLVDDKQKTNEKVFVGQSLSVKNDNEEVTQQNDNISVKQSTPIYEQLFNYGKSELYPKNNNPNKVSILASNQSLFENDEINIIGTIFNAYILVSQNEQVYLIDQHAAHERIIYDKLCSQLESKTLVSQPLIFPITLNLTVEECSVLIQNLDVLNSLGFLIEEFGKNIFKVSSLPYALIDMDVQSFFMDLLKGRNALKQTSDEVKKYIIKKSCKSAVKAGNVLDKTEIEMIVNQMKSLKKLTCPHGRPIIITITKSEIEKWFGRIV